MMPQRRGQVCESRAVCLPLFDDRARARLSVDEQAATLIQRFADAGDKAIAALGNRLDIWVAAGLAEDFSQRRDVACQRVLFDESIRPDGAHQVVFLKDVAAVFDQYNQCVEGFGREHYRRAVA